MRAIDGGYSNFDSPDNVAATYRRGQRVRMKYQRNNHGPGGFIRMTLVPPEKMMNKKEHDKNAFYYTCWGANPTAAGSDELGKDQYGFGLIGGDGEQHEHSKGYYTMDVTIPPVVPDGKYVLGWVWYGGVGGSIQGDEQQEPTPYGYFSDYWSCSYIEISGGDALQSSYTPVFNNDMKKFSDVGCMSANDAPGVCSYEPCEVTGDYQVPRPFLDGNVPMDITPEHFGGSSPAGVEPTPVSVEATPEPVDPPTTGADPSSPEPVVMESPEPVTMDYTPAPMPVEMSIPPQTGDRDLEKELTIVKKRSCRCLAAGDRCWRKLANLTEDYCVKNTAAEDQPQICIDSCCDYCAAGLRMSRWLCQKEEIKAVCGM